MKNVSRHSSVGSDGLSGTAAATSELSKSVRKGCVSGANHSRHLRRIRLLTGIPKTSGTPMKSSLTNRSGAYSVSHHSTIIMALRAPAGSVR